MNGTTNRIVEWAAGKDLKVCHPLHRLALQHSFTQVMVIILHYYLSLQRLRARLLRWLYFKEIRAAPSLWAQRQTACVWWMLLSAGSGEWARAIPFVFLEIQYPFTSCPQASVESNPDQHPPRPGIIFFHFPPFFFLLFSPLILFIMCGGRKWW